MSLSSDKIADLRMKQLEMLQSIIGRMAGYGSAHKNYCITITTAICGAAVTLQRPFLTLLSLIPILVFWLLDTQYLRVERRFRQIFGAAAQESWETAPSFNFNLNSVSGVSFWDCAISWSVLVFYFPTTIGVVGCDVLP
ncbi:MAG: hypothetical protein RLZZ187_3761 [Pseudomonadota bacterium]|jgi:hypothetical protein